MKIIRKIACLALAVFLAPIFPAGAVEAGYTVFHGDRELPRVALTVDDCYNIDHVQAVIDLCREYNVPVTFFVIGKALKVKDREVWQAALDAGCEIGNHTFGHARPEPRRHHLPADPHPDPPGLGAGLALCHAGDAPTLRPPVRRPLPQKRPLGGGGH